MDVEPLLKFNINRDYWVTSDACICMLDSDKIRHQMVVLDEERVHVWDFNLDDPKTKEVIRTGVSNKEFYPVFDSNNNKMLCVKDWIAVRDEHERIIIAKCYGEILEPVSIRQIPVTWIEQLLYCDTWNMIRVYQDRIDFVLRKPTNNVYHLGILNLYLNDRSEPIDYKVHLYPIFPQNVKWQSVFSEECAVWYDMTNKTIYILDLDNEYKVWKWRIDDLPKSPGLIDVTKIDKGRFLLYVEIDPQYSYLVLYMDTSGKIHSKQIRFLELTNMSERFIIVASLMKYCAIDLLTDNLKCYALSDHVVERVCGNEKFIGYKVYKYDNGTRELIIVDREDVLIDSHTLAKTKLYEIEEEKTYNIVPEEVKSIDLTSKDKIDVEI